MLFVGSRLDLVGYGRAQALAQIGDSSMLEVVCKWLADSDAMWDLEQQRKSSLEVWAGGAHSLGALFRGLIRGDRPLNEWPRADFLTPDRLGHGG